VVPRASFVGEYLRGIAFVPFSPLASGVRDAGSLLDTPEVV
jgi:hypothetical protein